MFDTSTLLVVFLILLAASLSSYMLNVWTAVRNGRPLVHAAITVGTHCTAASRIARCPAGKARATYGQSAVG